MLDENCAKGRLVENNLRSELRESHTENLIRHILRILLGREAGERLRRNPSVEK